MGGALGRNMTETHEKMIFFNDASWKVYFSAKAGVLIALNSKPQRFSKLVVRVLRYVPGKCTKVIVVNWAKMGRSMKDRKFRVQSSLFRSLCTSIRPRIWVFWAEESDKLEDQEEEERYFLHTFKKRHFGEPRLALYS
jgi:hypothetical protein